MNSEKQPEQSDGEVDHCDKCENPAQWTWHDGMWSGGRYCNDHIREKLKKDRKLAEYRDAITTEENVTKLRGETAIIPAGAKPLDSTFPVVRTKGALDQVLNEDRELVTDGGRSADEIDQKTCTIKTCEGVAEWALWMGDDFSRVRDPHPVRDYEDGDIHPFVCSSCRHSGVFAHSGMEFVRPEEKLVTDGGVTSPQDEEPKLLYCDRCVGDTLHSWSGSDWLCDSCGRRWSR